MSTDKQKIKAFVRNKIHLLDRVDQEDAWARASLAKLRRGLGKNPAETPELWAITMAQDEDGIPAPEAWTASECGSTTRSEWAVHTALTFYALHRQGKSESMNDEGREKEDGTMRRGATFGAAMGALRMDTAKGPGVIRRFNAAITADGLAEFSRHALGVVQMLRSADRPVKLDYPAFAADLFSYQFPASRDAVILKWGRDFWRNVPMVNAESGKTTTQKEENSNGQ